MKMRARKRHKKYHEKLKRRKLEGMKKKLATPEATPNTDATPNNL